MARFGYLLITTGSLLCTVFAAVDTTVPINLGVILPFKSNSCVDQDTPWALDQGVKAGIEYAVENVNQDATLLKGYRLVTTYSDSECSDTTAPLAAIDMYLNKTANVFLGPAYDYAVAPIARFSPHWNIPLLTGGALVNAFTDKSQYKLLTQMLGRYEKISVFVSQLFTTFGFNKSALLFANNLDKNVVKGKTTWYFIAEGVHYTLKQLNGPETDYYVKQFDENSAYNATDILLDASLHARSKFTAQSRVLN